MGFPTPEQGDKFKASVAHTRMIKVESPPGTSATSKNTNREPDEAIDALNPNCNDQPKTNRKIVIAGDSLLHPINSRKMMVNKIPSVKLTKRGDNFSGMVFRLTT